MRAARGTRPALLSIVASVALIHGCVSDGAGPQRVETLAMNGRTRTFTLTIEEPGHPTLQVEGDAKGSPLQASEAGRPLPPEEAPRVRREVLAAFERQADRLSGVPAAQADLGWLELFRAAYEREPPTPTRTAAPARGPYRTR